MGYFIGWLVLAILVGALGSNRKIGFGFAFLWALLLSPVIGLIIVLVSPSLKEEEYKKKVLDENKKQTASLKKMQETTTVVQQLKDAKSLLDSGVLSQVEFDDIKEKIMSNKSEKITKPETSHAPDPSKIQVRDKYIPINHENETKATKEELLQIANSFFKSYNCPHPRYIPKEKIYEFIRNERLGGNEDLLKDYYYYAKAIGYPIWG